MSELHTFPLVSLKDVGSRYFPNQVVHAFRKQGFLAVTDHGASAELMDEAERLTRQLFTLWPLRLLERLHGMPDRARQRGFSPLLTERAAALTPGAMRAPSDLKAFWMARDGEQPEDPADNPYGPNVWPSWILPQFEVVMTQLMAEYKKVYFSLLEAIERGCDLPSGRLVGMARGAEHVLRPIFYPGSNRLRQMHIEVPAGARRSAPHGDINALTILRPRPGLWAHLNGKWVKADASDPAILWVNIGEMLAQVDGIEGFMPTIHCVGTPPGENDPEGDRLLADDRVAIPEFFHFLHSAELRRGLLVGDWFRERIRQITTG